LQVPAALRPRPLQLPWRCGVLARKRETPVRNDSATHPGSSAEFVTFMNAYQDMVFSLAARLTGNDAQAEDLSQEVFMKAYEHFGQLRTSPAVGGWLKTVTTRLALNHLSRHRRRWRLFSELRRADAEEADDEPGEIQIPTPDLTAGEVETQGRHALIEQALQQLPDAQRVPLVLYHFQEQSYEEIAALLDVSLAKVKTDIHRGRAALATRLARLGAARADLL
jgi:RNA polymerase sigma-70 factor (ECF subfamily)